MKVEIWAEIICPWCGLGEHRFESALRQVVHRDGVDVVHRSFQLDPTLSVGWAKVSRAHLGERRSIFDTDSLVQLATEMGLDPVHVREALETRQYKGAVEDDQNAARQLGAAGVPFFVIHRLPGSI